MTADAFAERLNALFRAPEPDAVTPARRERLAILGAAGTAEGPQRWLTETHLLFARHLVERGRLGEGW